MTDLALHTIRTRAPGFQPTVAVVLGSGWGEFTSHLERAVRIPYSDLEGFPQATVAGHSGELWLGHLGARQVAVMSGRKHGYESGSVDGMKAPLKTLKALGCQILVQTNASGSLKPAIPPGSVVVLSDHINFPQRSPLVGETGSERFVSMVDAYDPQLRMHAHQVAARQGIALLDAVYAWAFGPQFETPAEIRMFAALGADVVGMSTVPETILARHMGLRVLALSLVTNMGAGLSHEMLSHAHTLAQAQENGSAASALLAAIVQDLEI
jgi:purine-nucleoside phosphorylase